MRVFAPAKINLTLEVGYPYRATGRHPLQSVVTFADVGDWIELAANPNEVTLHIDGPFSEALIQQSGNIVLDAVDAISARSEAWGADITLIKNLPIASGIGGGSADAAATLRALNDWWLTNLSEAELIALAKDLGGDVPVCVASRSAYMTGEGEVVTPIDLPALNAVLVNPGVAVSTADVFRAFDAANGGAKFVEKPAPDWRSFDDVVAGMGERGNMLAAPARGIAPIIGDMESVLRADKRVRAAALSGSGATMFALVESADDARALASDLSQAQPKWWVTPARLGALDAGPGGL